VKVLLLHQHFNIPQKGGAIRSYYLAKALFDKGIETVVITAHNEKSYRKENVEDIEVHYLPVAYDNKFGFAARAISFLKFNWGVMRLARKINRVDYCYAISVPLTIGLAAMWIKKFYKIPFIFEVGDLWPDAPIQLGFVQNYFFKQFLFSMEKQIYYSAKSIVALSPAIEDAVKKKIAPTPRSVSSQTERSFFSAESPASGTLTEVAKINGEYKAQSPETETLRRIRSLPNIHLIPNMADCDFYKPEIKSPALEDKFNVKSKFVISYIGAVGVANGLDYFLECANASRKAELPIHFLLCGEGALRERLKDNVKQMSLQNLTFIGFQNREGVKEVMNVTDAAFICYKNVPILETGSPNKFFDGLAAGKLIIVNFGGWIKNEIEEARCGIFVDPKHPTDFIKKISPFLSDEKQLKNYQEASRQLAEKKYSRKIVSERFAKLFY
jgi:glycosyltransferase involved in cell wall biosynthesis